MEHHQKPILSLTPDPGPSILMKLLDRMLVRSYLKSYLICLVSLLSLYVVLDLFTNLDNFTEGKKNFSEVLRHIGIYYSFKVPMVFDRLCEAIVLLAAMFTVAWIQRNNELLPVLSAGVSTRRMVLPVLVSACAMVALAIANQEFVLPHVDNYVLENRRDLEGTQDIAVSGTFDSNKVLIKGRSANRSQLLIRNFHCTFPDGSAGITHLEAREARYVAPNGSPRSGGWLLVGTNPLEIDNLQQPEILEMITPGKYFLHTDKDFEAVTRQRNWWVFMPTWRLYHELTTADPARVASVAVLFHMRLTRPALGLILVFLGLSVILRDQNRNVFISTGLCLILCALFFGASIVCKQLGENEYISPPLAAWLPVLNFGPLSLVLFDAIHT
jgi:lipopolysaccharide export system permease protein